MADHDSLCPAHPARPWAQTDCRCGLIDKVRADERRRAVERVRIPRDVAPPQEEDVFVPLADVIALIEEAAR